MKDKTKKTKAVTKKPAKAAVKKTAKKKPAVKAATKPKVAATDRPADWTPDSTTAWAQKRGLKQIVIWGPESVRDKVRVASKRDGVPMSTWILDAIDARLRGNKSVAASKTKTATKRKPQPIGEDEHAAVAGDVAAASVASDEAAA